MNTIVPHVTMNLSSINNAVKIINKIFTEDAGSGTYTKVPTLQSLDNRSVGHMCNVIKNNMVAAGVGADIETPRAYRSDVNKLFKRLDVLLTVGLPAVLATPTSTKKSKRKKTTSKKK